MEKFEVIKEILGDNIAPFVAADLREAYHNIANDDGNVPMFSHNPEEELKEKLAYLQALRKVYTWYAVGEIDDEEIIND